MITWYLLAPAKSAELTYLQTGLLGFAVGYWAVFVTTAAEQFGTNLRATVATTVPNFVRGALAPALLIFGWLRKDGVPMIESAVYIGIATMVLALLGWFFLRETYGKDLEYVEE